VLALQDVTQALSMSQQAAYRATHDDLTGLPNRTLLLDRVEQALANARRGRSWVAALFVDLDGFKRINEGLGHAAGDALLCEVAQRLKASERLADTVARWGSDGFVVVIENLGSREAIAAVARRLLQVLSQPYHLDAEELRLSGSVGISVFPLDAEHTDGLLQGAEAAVQRAKGQGRNTFCFYSPEMNDWTAERLRLEQELHHALESGGLELFYQPLVRLGDGGVMGCEALVRWRHPARGLLSPAQFISLAEETGLIHPLGEWVLHAACAQARRWSDAGLAPPYVAVNLSPVQFAGHDLYATVAAAIAASGLATAALKLEITESLLLRDVEGVVETLRALRALGASVSIDDFGTGYSSLSYLRRFPIDQLKIDRSFVRDVMRNRDDAAIAQAVIALAHSLDLTVIAEGVEDASQLGFFKERHCDGVQGHYFSAALPAEQMTAFLKR
jgi:diguanylate cyclase (GGDEF)-like protein